MPETPKNTPMGVLDLAQYDSLIKQYITSLSDKLEARISEPLNEITEQQLFNLFDAQNNTFITDGDNYKV